MRPLRAQESLDQGLVDAIYRTRYGRLMSIYEGTQTERDYRAGVDDGRTWRELDRNEGSFTYWLETFRREAETARQYASRGLRAYYLGVMRGYREELN
jgi:hypothetical protein